MVSPMLLERYDVVGHLGEGTYGTVAKVRDKVDGTILALKRMAPVEEADGIAAATIREVMLLKRCSHPNIVGLRHIHMKIPEVAIALEYCEYDLKKYMKLFPDKLIPMVEVKQFMHHFCCGLAYLHQVHHVVHRDLKLQNLLISDGPGGKVLKVADFGLARIDGFPIKKYSHDAVTLWYRAPDIILGNVLYGFTADMWSAGVLFAQMITGDLLFHGRDDATQLHAIFSFLGHPTPEKNFPSMYKYRKSDVLLQNIIFDEPPLPNEHLLRQERLFRSTRFADDPRARDLLLRLLRYEPSERMSAFEALQHPYFSDVVPLPGSLPLSSAGDELLDDSESGVVRIIPILVDQDGEPSSPGSGCISARFSTSAELAEALWLEAALQARRSETSSTSFMYEQTVALAEN